MTAETLLALAERCEKAEGPSYSLDCEVWDAIYPGERDERFRKLCEDSPYRGRLGPADKDGYVKPFRAFTASLDAAMTLVPEGIAWTVDGGDPSCLDSASLGRVPGRGQLMELQWVGEGVTPALALTAAALRARAALKALSRTPNPANVSEGLEMAAQYIEAQAKQARDTYEMIQVQSSLPVLEPTFSCESLCRFAAAIRALSPPLSSPQGEGVREALSILQDARLDYEIRVLRAVAFLTAPEDTGL